jgi:hypothetical protein
MMTPSVTAALQKAIRQLENERHHIDRQIAGIRAVLDGTERRARPARPRRSVAHRTAKRRRMSLAARRAVSQRMKAYWAARKGAVAKAKEKKP